MTHKIYCVFGLRVSSDVPLPDFVELPSEDYDAKVSIGVISRPTGIIVSHGLRYTCTNDTVLFWVDEVATYSICGGTQITVEPCQGSDMVSVTRFLITTGLFVLLQQRKMLAMKFCAVEKNNGVIAITGASGVGKSTLITALSFRGWIPIADDFGVLSGNATVGFQIMSRISTILLWKDIVRIFKERVKVLGELNDSIGKVHVDIATSASTAMLKGLICLSEAPLKSVQSRRIDAARAYDIMRRDGVIGLYAEKSMYAHVHKQGLMNLANGIPITHLSRPRETVSTKALSALCDAMEQAVQ